MHTQACSAQAAAHGFLCVCKGLEGWPYQYRLWVQIITGQSDLSAGWAEFSGDYVYQLRLVPADH